MYKMKKVGKENLIFLGKDCYMFQGIKYRKNEINLFFMMKQIPKKDRDNLLDFSHTDES